MTLLDLLPAFTPYRRPLAGGVAAIFAAAGLGLVTPWLVGRAIDELGASPSAATFLRYGVSILLVTALQGAFSFLQRRTLVALSRDVEFDLRNQFFAHLEAQPPSFFQQRFTGDLMARATSDLGAVRMVCGPAIMYGAHTVFASLGALVLMVRIDARLTLVALAALPVVALATKLLGERVHRRYEVVQAQFADLTTRVQESFAGARVVRAYAQEAHEERDFGRANDRYVALNRGLAAISTSFHPALQGLVGVSFVAVLALGGAAVRRGELTLGELVSFQLLLGKLVWPMIAVGWVTNLVQRGAASYARLREVLDVVPEIRDAPEAQAPPLGSRLGGLSVRDLTVRFPGRPAPAVDEVSFELAPGERLAVVGRTGSGKSTLLAAIARLVEGECEGKAGTVVLDGVEVRRWPLADLRRQVSVVPQETFLFSATVRDNIAFGRPEAGAEEIEHAARLAELGRDIERWPHGLDTLVGERGVTLSGGQKQRVALARAVLRLLDPVAPSRLLLLDDAFSAVDPRTEAAILGNLDAAVRGVSVLFVSHRLATLRRADRVVMLEGGMVQESGRPEALLASGGAFAAFARRQRLLEEVESENDSATATATATATAMTEAWR